MGTKNNSNLFYTCSLIEYIGRIRKQKRCIILDLIGKETLERIYDYADIFHCEPIEKVASEFSRYLIPDYWTIGEVYERVIEDCYQDSEIVNGIWDVYHSWLDESISDYNTDFYFQSRDYIAECYKAGEILE